MLKTVKHIVLPIAIMAIGLLYSCNQQVKEVENDLKLWYDQPAADWNEALPVGNGRLGAMVFGSPELEHLQLNEETIWAGGPHNNVNPAVAPWLKKVRELIFAGKYAESHDVANNNIKAFQNGMPYQTMGDLYMNFPDNENVSDYYRELDIANAIARVKYTNNNIYYTREVFSSFTDDVVIVHLTASEKNSINLDLSFKTPQKHTLSVQNNEIAVRGITSDHEGIPGQVKFTTIIKPVITEGNMEDNDSSISISNASIVTLYISCATNFVNYKDLSAKPDLLAQEKLSNALLNDYAEAKSKHIDFYKSYFDRVHIDLGVTDSIYKPTNIRIKEFKEANDPQLAALYFQFGRYLLISSSQPGGQPANLQGIWNYMLNPPWESKYTININCEMNYWPAEITNLSELHQPLFDMVEDLSVTGQEGAKKIYNARGWVAHHNTDIWRSSGIYDRATYGMWQSGGNWLTQHLWQHYLFTGDTAFLKKYYPTMKSAAQFYVDDLVEEPHTGYMVICPSNSPENKYMDIASSSAGTTMDNQLLFDLFSNVITSSKILGVDSEFADTLANLKKRLAPMQIGRYNQLQEWLYDWDDPESKHRHVSHLYGLFPSNQISPFTHPELFQAAKQSLIYRGDESTGWSMGWKVNLWARLLDGNHAYKLIKDQISPAKRPNGEVHGGTYPNLFDAHPPFQIDGNFGCTSGISEMLVQSHDGFVFILPALPDEWKKGSISGIKTRGDFEVTLSWKDNRIEKLIIKSTIGGNLRLRTRDEITFSDGKDLVLAEGENSNPLFYVNKIKEPLISKEAHVEKLNLPKTYLYDIPTKKGESYTFILK